MIIYIIQDALWLCIIIFIITHDDLFLHESWWLIVFVSHAEFLMSHANSSIFMSHNDFFLSHADSLFVWVTVTFPWVMLTHYFLWVVMTYHFSWWVKKLYFYKLLHFYILLFFNNYRCLAHSIVKVKLNVKKKILTQ